MIDTIFELQQQVIDGNANALEAYINLKKLEKALASVIANVQPYAMDEASRYGERTFDKFGAKVELKNAAIVACEYETAASYREKEKEYLQTVMDKIETNKQI
jgi:hypothetical protein